MRILILSLLAVAAMASTANAGWRHNHSGASRHHASGARHGGHHGQRRR